MAFAEIRIIRLTEILFMTSRETKNRDLIYDIDRNFITLTRNSVHDIERNLIHYIHKNLIYNIDRNLIHDMEVLFMSLIEILFMTLPEILSVTFTKIFDRNLMHDIH